jgi:hypothetical protein
MKIAINLATLPIQVQRTLRLAAAQAVPSVTLCDRDAATFALLDPDLLPRLLATTDFTQPRCPGCGQ